MLKLGMKQDLKDQTMAQRQDEFMDDFNIKCLYATDKSELVALVVVWDTNFDLN
jgi:hypothetical protein